jgi:hypothetical protein
MPSWRSVDISGGPLYVCLSLATVAIVARLAHSARTFPAAFAWCMIGGLLIGYHTYIQDCLVLLFALAMLSQDLPRPAALAMVLVVLPLPYFLLQWGPPYSALFVVLVASAPLLTVWDGLKRRAAVAEEAAVQGRGAG